ncbi:MAG: hypothetical protein IIT51_05135, partial [Oscillospiraceae bacterium]|nr:hypothetical protein [Oscillospiraceae bacterium]
NLPCGGAGGVLDGPSGRILGAGALPLLAGDGIGDGLAGYCRKCSRDGGDNGLPDLGPDGFLLLLVLLLFLGFLGSGGFLGGFGIGFGLAGKRFEGAIPVPCLP